MSTTMMKNNAQLYTHNQKKTNRVISPPFPTTELPLTNQPPAPAIHRPITSSSQSRPNPSTSSSAPPALVQRTSSGGTVPKVRLKVSSGGSSSTHQNPFLVPRSISSNNPATASSSSSSIPLTTTRNRPVVKYHYPIILDDDEEDDEDDFGDEDYAENRNPSGPTLAGNQGAGTFSPNRKRKDLGYGVGDGKNKKTGKIEKQTKGKKTVYRREDNIKNSSFVDVNAKKKSEKIQSVQKNTARRDKLNSGLGGNGGNASSTKKKINLGFADSSDDELSSLPDEYKSEDEKVGQEEAKNLAKEKRRRRHGGTKKCSCSTRGHRRRHRERESLPEGPELKQEAYNDEPQLPDGIDPTNVEDVFLDMMEPVNPGWSTDEEEEEILFAALDELEDSAQSDEEHADRSDGSGDETSDTMSSGSEDDDYFMGDDGFGYDSASNLPLVVMEDWSGNLVFAQPVINQDDRADRHKESRSTSKSRSKGSRQSGRGSKGSLGTSTINGEGPALLVDAEAFETEGDADDFDEYASDGGDTTDSLPEEDMPSPPDIIPFSMAAAGLEANNAAFGVTTVDEAALARDLGLPLADARQLLERARAEEQHQILGGVSELSMNGDDVAMLDAAENNLLQLVQEASPSPQEPETWPRPQAALITPAREIPSPGINSVTSVSTPSNAPPPGIPMMGSFTPDVANPERLAVIDGTGKTAPSPFIRRGIARGRTKGSDRSRLKKRTLGESPAASPAGRPRYSSVPASNRFGSMRGSPMHSNLGREPFDREDTPSDMEMMIEPISIDDVLDADALHHYTHELDQAAGLDGHEPRQLRNLQRWERVPITTFRRSRNAGEVFASPSAQQTSSGPFRGTFTSPSMTSTLAAGTHAGSLAYAHGMMVSPVLEAVNEDSVDENRARRRKDRKIAKNGGMARNRTSSLGSMPSFNLEA